MIIGITGGTGCGKTTLLEILQEHGALILDCDAIYHRLLREDGQLLAAIEDRFPGTVEEGVLQRKKLGTIVFGDPAALADLNKITHGAVKKEVLRLLEEKPALTAIDAIGLFESGLNELCKLTVAVTAPTEARVQWLMVRDGISEAYALARINAQPSAAEFASRCDYTLENASSREDFQQKCLAFLTQIGIMTI